MLFLFFAHCDGLILAVLIKKSMMKKKMPLFVFPYLLHGHRMPMATNTNLSIFLMLEFMLENPCRWSICAMQDLLKGAH